MKNVFNTIKRIHVLSSSKHVKKKKIKTLLDEIKDLTLKVEGRAVSFFQDTLTKKLRSWFPNHHLFKKVKSTIEFSDTIKLLVDSEAFEGILKNIKKAKKSIHIQMFIWKNDNIGIKIGHELLKAANRGVNIEIWKDSLGGIYEIGNPAGRGFIKAEFNIFWKIVSKILGLFYSEPCRKMKDFKIADQLASHSNVKIVNSFVKDHSKYFIFDDKILMIGGMNIGDEYFKDSKGIQARHDFMVEIASKAVVFKFKQRIKGSHIDNFDSGSSIEFSFNLNHKKGKQFEIASKVEELLDLAKSEVIIEMAYLGDSAITKKLIEIVNKGICVRLIIPKKSNIQDALNKKVAHFIFDKTDGKIEIFLYPRNMHSKVMLIDGKYTFLGSANLNFGALRGLKETNIIIDDTNCPFTISLRNALLKDIALSKKIKKLESIKVKWPIAFGEEIVSKIV